MILSIVTPSYNQGNYLAETIESVICQEGDFWIDYIIMDGGSKDDSVEIIKRYEKLLDEKYWDIKCRGITYRWLSENDRGQTDALTKGFCLADGEILAWLNSDDTYLAGALSKIVEVFAEHSEVAVVYGKTYYTDPQGVITGQYPTEPFDFRRLAISNYICQPATFFRKEAFEAAGGLDSNLRFVMDYDLWIRLAKRFEFRYVQKFLATYRLHEESKTVSDKNALANHKEALSVARKYFDWAPLSRVYCFCHSYIVEIYPIFLKKIIFLTTFSAFIYTIISYIYLNKGIRKDDLRNINFKNIRKLFRTRMDMYKET